VDEPHWTPPSVPPVPTRCCQRILPLSSGSTACTTPDFCPATSARLPLASDTSIAGEEKSKSGAFSSGQFVLSAMRHAVFQASPVVICRAQRIFPVSRSSAMNASLMFVAGAL